jgi:HEAT repeats
MPRPPSAGFNERRIEYDPRIAASLLAAAWPTARRCLLRYRQLDLFAEAGSRPEETAPAVSPPRFATTVLDDDELVAAIPRASLGSCRALTAEAGRRKLARAVPALEVLCRRFRGFGLERAVPEQTAALAALAAIGGSAAAAAAARLIVEGVVQGPGLAAAVDTAARLGAGLPSGVVAPLLCDAAPEIRAGACYCARPSPSVIPLLATLLDDLDRRVAKAAACALGRMGRSEARPALQRLLREAPSAAVIDAAIAVANEECLVILGRIARTRPDLADAALAALDGAESPRAATIAAAARRSLPP